MINNAIYYLVIVLSTSSLLFFLYLIFQINYCLSDYPFQNEDRFSHKDDALQWAACVSLSVHETGRLQDASVHKIVAQSVKRQVVSALTNFTDIGMNCHILLLTLYSLCFLPVRLQLFPVNSVLLGDFEFFAIFDNGSCPYAGVFSGFTPLNVN